MPLPVLLLILLAPACGALMLCLVPDERHAVIRRIAVASASLAGLGAWRFDVAQNEWNDMKTAGTYDYSALTAVEDRGHRWGLVANIGVSAALLSTVATIAVAF